MPELNVCQIPGNSDVAGVGVRASVYLQACIISLVIMRMIYSSGIARFNVRAADIEGNRPADTSQDRGPSLPQTSETKPPSRPSTITGPSKIWKEYSDCYVLAKALEQSLFMVRFAVILSAILETKSSSGLSAYHILVVLNISQINNWAGLILNAARTDPDTPQGPISSYRRSFRKSIVVWGLFGSAHSTMMSGFGLYFWSNPSSFFAYAAESPQQPCQPLAYFWFFGLRVFVLNHALRTGSLVYYSITIIPIFGFYSLALLQFLAITPVLFLFIVLGLLASVGMKIFYLVVIAPIKYFLKPLLRPILRILIPDTAVPEERGPIERSQSPQSDSTRDNIRRRSLKPSTPFSYIFPILGSIAICTPIAYLIISTELMIRVNSSNAELLAESKWTYGQTLALFTATVSLALYIHDLIKIMQRRGLWKPTSMDPRQILERPTLISKEIQTELIQIEKGKEEVISIWSCSPEFAINDSPPRPPV
ncbi:hypothetical protein DXG01_006807 [Tephrocybe rancida]|nr:hypothetical protein DXG01_006807 [Tephrocybe rancida]